MASLVANKHLNPQGTHAALRACAAKTRCLFRLAAYVTYSSAAHPRPDDPVKFVGGVPHLRSSTALGMAVSFTTA